ncbi:TadE/TadG family type IV pilus assembly protein [Falsibacillus pallidus]|uniref:TadE/TadG family type IV pilus assembly protein n=1 Tax=Falsibacillus pallidus TaxID=493781 RepID=UPI003D952382
MRLLRKVKNERGSMTLEFIGVLPFFFLFMLLIFQGFALGYGIITAQSAVNEAAKVYAAGDTYEDAKTAAEKIIGGGKTVTMSSLSIPPEDADGKFEATLQVKVDLIFIPNQWKRINSLTVTQTADSRVMNSVFH